MKNVFLISMGCLLLSHGASIAGELGNGGVDYIKYIRSGNEGSAFYNLKCKKGRPVDVLYEPQNSQRWFTVPAGDEHLSFYQGPSENKFAQAACEDRKNTNSSTVLKITGGVGSTASGIKSYEITCSNNISYDASYDPTSNSWMDIINNIDYSKYKEKNIKDFATKFCRDR